MDRRTFVGSLTMGLLASPLAAEAQQPGKVYTVGILNIGAPDQPGRTSFWQPFLDAMHELNYVEGRNLIVTRASAAGRAERLAGLARDLVQANMDVIVTTSTRETQAPKEATSRIPIVMTFAPDPVGQGLVASLSRPGGERNRPDKPRSRAQAEVCRVAQGGRAGSVPLRRHRQFRVPRAQGVIAPADAVTLEHRRALVGVILRHRLPAIYWVREYVDDGGLMAYSTNLKDLRRRAAIYVDKILKGAKPADLPIEQPTKFELVINLKTAKALGLTIPPPLLLRADEVIQ